MAKVKGIKIGNYSVTLSSTGIVAADGTSGRHLTACYNFRTNSIDIHVTDEGTKEKIVRIHFNIFDVLNYFQSLTSRVEKIIPVFMESIFKVTPVWLARHGYYIIRYSESDFKNIFRSSVSVIRNKYHFDKSRLKRNVRSWSVKRDYSPYSLNRIDVNDSAFIIAARKGFWGSKQKLILFQSDKPQEFHAIRFSVIERLFDNFIDPNIIRKLEESLDRIFAEFDLDGLTDEAEEFVEMSLKCLS